MAKTFTAPFAQTPQTATAVVTAAVSSITSDAPTNTVEILTAGTDGAILTGLTAIPRATVTASSLVVFSSLDGGTTKRLIRSALMSAQTVSSTAEVTKTNFSDITETTPIRLKAGKKIYVGSQVALASGIVFYAQWTDY